MKIKVVTNDGRLTKRTSSIIHAYENMGVKIRETFEKKLIELEHQALLESCFGEELHLVGDKIQTTKDRIVALKEILAAL